MRAPPYMFRDAAKYRTFYKPKFWFRQKWEYHVSVALGQDRRRAYPRYTAVRDWGMIWLKRGAVKPEVHDVTLAPNCVAVDPNKYLDHCLKQELSPQLDYKLPWPFNERPLKGTQADPSFDPRGFLVYDGSSTMLLDGENQALHFSNSILESINDMPPSIEEKVQRVSNGAGIRLDEHFINLTLERLNWVHNGDATLMRMPPSGPESYKPFLHRLPLQWGIPTARREFNTIWNLYDLTEMWISQNIGFSDKRTIWCPKSIFRLNRNKKRLIMDLWTDFVTITRSSPRCLPHLSGSPLSTIDSPLVDVSPLDWNNCFVPSSFDRDPNGFHITSGHQVDTVYLTSQTTKPLERHWIQARLIMYAYGYARQMAEDHGKSGELDEPLMTKVVMYNIADESLYTAFLQLNTTEHDSAIKNQVWLSGPYKELPDILTNMISIGLHSFDEKNN